MIQYHIDPESLADVTPQEYETALRTRLDRAYPGVEIAVEFRAGRTWGTLRDGTEIDRSELARVGNDAFADCCNAAN